MKRCEVCGFSLGASASVCLSCGTRAEPKPPAAAPAMGSVMDTASFVVPASRKIVIVWAAVTVVIMLAAAAFSLLAR